MANKQFKSGDSVQLKSGGPIMTVAEIKTGVFAKGTDLEGKYHCQWFSGSTLRSGYFKAESLKPAPKELDLEI